MSIAEIPPPTRVGPESNGMLMTPEEFDSIDDWEEHYRYELVNGVLIVTPPAGIGQQNPNDELGYLLRTYRDTHPQGHSLDDTVPEHMLNTPSGRRVADRVIWTGLGRLPNYRDDIPRIAIEFVSRRSRDRRRDYIEKREEYAAIGIEEYWVIDRYRRSMTVFRGTETEIVVRESETYHTDLLPGFELPLGRLLAIADRCGEDE